MLQRVELLILSMLQHTAQLATGAYLPQRISRSLLMQSTILFMRFAARARVCFNP